MAHKRCSPETGFTPTCGLAMQCRSILQVDVTVTVTVQTRFGDRVAYQKRIHHVRHNNAGDEDHSLKAPYRSLCKPVNFWGSVSLAKMPVAGSSRADLWVDGGVPSELMNRQQPHHHRNSSENDTQHVRVSNEPFGRSSGASAPETLLPSTFCLPP